MWMKHQFVVVLYAIWTLTQNSSWWCTSLEYSSCLKIFQSLKVVNDGAERGVATLWLPNSKPLTRDENEFQKLVQCIGDNRKRFPGVNKSIFGVKVWIKFFLCIFNETFHFGCESTMHITSHFLSHSIYTYPIHTPCYYSSHGLLWWKWKKILNFPNYRVKFLTLAEAWILS
jgi:hypothetical protein